MVGAPDAASLSSRIEEWLFLFHPLQTLRQVGYWWFVNLFVSFADLSCGESTLESILTKLFYICIHFTNLFK
ncbi:hypothetical protein Hanom_Chr12g01164421 [Helianthus anomalus]